MNALHNLVAQGKVLYLVQLFFFLSQQPYSGRMTGNFRHASVDRAQGEPMREGPWKDPVLDLPGKMERARAFV